MNKNLFEQFMFRVLTYWRLRSYEWSTAEICQQDLFLQVLQYVLKTEKVHLCILAGFPWLSVPAWLL